MSVGPRFIGYDIRVRPGDSVDDWVEWRRNMFLLRQDAPNPLSVDTAVWSRPEKLSLESMFGEFGFGFLGLLATPPRSSIGDALLIAVSVHPETWTLDLANQWNETVRSSNGVAMGLLNLEEGRIQDPLTGRFQLLGYDVADTGLISGLSNCGYASDEPVPKYREKWSVKLSAFHLFDNLSDASQFVDFANHRAPEHAPFCVFGLWCEND